MSSYRFNPPPGWPPPPADWTPPPGWQPDPSWPPPPPGWQLWTAAPETAPRPQQPLWAPLPVPPQWNLEGKEGKDAKRSGLFGRGRGKENEELAQLRAWVTETQGLDAAQTLDALARARAEAAAIREEAGADARETLAAAEADAREALAAAEAQARETRTAAEAQARELLREAKQGAKREQDAAKEAERAADRARKGLEACLRDTAAAQLRLTEIQARTVVTEEAVMLQEVGVYRYHHPLDDAIAYRTRLETIQADIKRLAGNGQAVLSITNWTVNGSSRQGTKMVKDFSKLMLRAYNAEADQAVRTMRPHRIGPLVDRLYKTRETIAKLGATMQIRISDEYHDARVRELHLTADHLQKKEEEKELQRELRARQREEEKAQREFEREQAKLEKERDHVQSAIARLRERGDLPAADRMRAKLDEIEEALRAVEARAANIRTGYVYVISNVGAFGDRMVKIGLTRRLEPLDRISELSGASVPFRYDVHALIFSEDAVSLETRLHQHFADRRVNRVNSRREFFYVTPGEVRDALAEFAGQHLVEFTDQAEALEWRASTGGAAA
ncbi:DUF4041 domain-containing protein [Kitasatospora viridis]|uniref:T5orf172 domain-containing protein n=1 Tax=Kitasatospora viridis TaxID=281105 RepID=A0A561UMU9_9ACTN|nr:DUF4041 domain-containing protein [Kitasatospora viridis]TWG00693.1 T5orf172 domain-containing protein [Kitasatospora viridis]